MPNKILVTYASRAGSTAGVAEAIANTLADSGVQVDVLPVQDVHDLSTYNAVVVGSAIRGAKWLPEAVQFMKSNQSTLAQKPCAMFSVCITMTMKNPDYHQAIAHWVDPIRSLVTPVSEEFFAGALDFSKLPITFNTLLMRLSVKLGVWSEGDHRDWIAIQDWAASLKPKLLS